MPESALILDGRPLSLAAVEVVARGGRPVAIGKAARDAVAAARAVVEHHAGGAEVVYGVNTGFGSLARYRITPEAIRELQHNLIRSHAAGVGHLLPVETVRAMLLILTASLCRGHSGVRPVVIEQLVELLNRHVTPAVPGRGSVGASGDLAPLAHAALLLIGEGQAMVEDRTVPGAAALAQAGLKPIELEAKEGLALINGTHGMAAAAALALADVGRLTDAAIGSAAMAIDACRATHSFLDDRLHVARQQIAQRTVADRLRRSLEGSQIAEAHARDDPRVQDPYCLRATPQVVGAAMDAIAFVDQVVGRELGAVTDNPLVFLDGDEGDIRSGGNFHGMPLAIGLDLLTIALCHIAGIAERRIYWVLGAFDPQNPVNAHLSPHPGLHSGLMIVQYTAAACCNELQTLATPASVANIPTSAGIEDYNSFGATSAHQATAAVALATNVIACELLVMAEAMEYQRPLRSGTAVEAAHAAIRQVVPKLTADRPPAPDIAAIAELIRSGVIEG